ncbi:MAG: Dabb family protein [Christensenellales bacterium]|jgi:hypothetical protein
MIKHVVMYKLNDPGEENKRALVDKFMSMKDKIPCLLSIESGVDLIKSERSYDVCLICTFKGLKELDEYREHPVHIPVMNYVKSIVSKSHSVDYEVENE